MPALDPAVAISLALSFSLLFVASAWHKLRDTAQFSETIAAYRLLPQLLVVPFARLLALLEIVIGVGLLVPGARASCAGIGAFLLLTYAFAIGINLVRGRRTIDCGCLGFGPGNAIAPWMVYRNFTLSVLALTLLLPQFSRALGLIDAVTIAGSVIVAAMQYLALDYLLQFGLGRRAAEAWLPWSR